MTTPSYVITLSIAAVSRDGRRFTVKEPGGFPVESNETFTFSVAADSPEQSLDRIAYNGVAVVAAAESGMDMTRFTKALARLAAKLEGKLAPFTKG